MDNAITDDGPSSNLTPTDGDRIAWMSDIAIPCMEALAEEAASAGRSVTYEADLGPQRLPGVSRSLRLNIDRPKGALSQTYKALFTVVVTELGEIKAFGYGERFALLGRIGDVKLADLRSALDRIVRPYGIGPRAA
ncbi:hypothetical protein ASG43_09415 [Aureimonas sp. Leaf454]|uniref:hypothetical protein n=1 Tax=Aureimonas sp. Leaf454 TaxID=1736381 RepID=UPI0006FF85C0|nr:hypothetical protein [Aureimonas sp. Leaf454]KQT47340.1 hypothetical protein ASG43_09415 [Aureimonas sp. Leaf454]